MVHLAVGDGAWGLVASRRLSTKLRLGQGGETLGVINKLIKRSDRELYAEVRLLLLRQCKMLAKLWQMLLWQTSTLAS
jgi:hypothetical protein